MTKLEDEIEFSKLYKRNQNQAITLLYGKVLDIEKDVADVKRIMSILFGLFVVPIVGILIAALLKLIIK